MTDDSRPEKEVHRPTLNYELIENTIPPRLLTPSWSPESYKGPYVLPVLPHIVSNHHKIPDYLPTCGQLQWFDAATGLEGFGAISLVSHVLHVSLDEAAWRLAMFATFLYQLKIERFLKYRE